MGNIRIEASIEDTSDIADTRGRNFQRPKSTLKSFTQV
jgi:hypothetical protein